MKIILLFLFSTLAIAQTPVAEIPNATVIGPEGITITAISIPNAVLQFGIGITWCTTITGPKLPLLVSWISSNPPLCPFDPAPMVVKSIVAQQQATAYTVTYTNPGSTNPITKTIPALIAPVTTKTIYIFTCTSTAALTNGAPLPTAITLTGATCTAVKQ